MTKVSHLQATPGERGRDLEKPADMLEVSETYQEITKLSLDPNNILSCHASQLQQREPENLSEYYRNRRLCFAVHPSYPLLVSAGSDLELMFWSDSHTSKKQETLLSKPTCLKFSPKGSLLCIGYEDGLVELFRFSHGRKSESSEATAHDSLKKLSVKLQEKDTAVLNIEFSNTEASKGAGVSKGYLAVSYFNRASEAGSWSHGGLGYVKVYELEYQFKQTDRLLHEQPAASQADFSAVSVREYRVIKPYLDDQKKADRKPSAYFMSFSESGVYIIINFQIFDQHLNQESDGKEKNYVIWDLDKDKQLNDKDGFQKARPEKFNFPNHVNAYYRCHEKFLDPGLKKGPVSSFTGLNVTAMKHFANPTLDKEDKKNLKVIHNFICFGSSRGDLHLVKDTCLFVADGAVASAESIRDNAFCLSKCYAAHCSPLDLIEVAGDRVFTCALGDEAIFEWAINWGDVEWELDHMQLEDEDKKQDIIYREVESKEVFNKNKNEKLEPRLYIREVREQAERSNSKDSRPEKVLRLEKVIGRKAFDRRNNLFYTANNHLIFSAGSLLVTLNIPPEGKELPKDGPNEFFREQFLEVDAFNPKSTSPEISILTLTPDRKQVCVGTIEKKAKLITWDLMTNTFLKSWTLEDCCVVLNLCFSGDKKRLICVALTENYTQIVKLIDNLTSEVLGSADFTYSLPFKIKNVEFLPKSNDEFFTFGFQHMSRWKLKGGLVNFTEMPIENKDDMMKHAGLRAELQEKEKNKNRKTHSRKVYPLKVTFRAVIFLYDDVMIAAGDDGFVRSSDAAVHLERRRHRREEERAPQLVHLLPRRLEVPLQYPQLTRLLRLGRTRRQRQPLGDEEPLRRQHPHHREALRVPPQRRQVQRRSHQRAPRVPHPESPVPYARLTRLQQDHRRHAQRRHPLLEAAARVRDQEHRDRVEEPAAEGLHQQRPPDPQKRGLRRHLQPHLLRDRRRPLLLLEVRKPRAALPDRLQAQDHLDDRAQVRPLRHPRLRVRDQSPRRQRQRRPQRQPHQPPQTARPQAEPRPRPRQPRNQELRAHLRPQDLLRERELQREVPQRGLVAQLREKHSHRGLPHRSDQTQRAFRLLRTRRPLLAPDQSRERELERAVHRLLERQQVHDVHGLRHPRKRQQGLLRPHRRRVQRRQGLQRPRESRLGRRRPQDRQQDRGRLR